jgi:chromosome segregation ATPase
MESMHPTSSQANSQDMLGSAVARVSTSLATLERVVDKVMSHAQELEQRNALAQPQQGIGESELIASVDKWRSRFTLVEKERDDLQEMLVALKRRYEDVMKQNGELTQKLDEKELEYNRLLDAVDEVGGRLDISLGLIEEVLEYA